MKIPKAVLKKLLIYQQFAPDLKFYNRIDSFGASLSKELPDWNRSPISLDLYNRSKRQKVALTFRDVLFEYDSPGSHDEQVEIVRRVIHVVEDSLRVVQFSRFSLRGYFLAAASESFASLHDRVRHKFAVPAENIAAFSGMEPKDFGYVVELEREKWRFTIKLGPMEKPQWFSQVPHNRDSYPDDMTYAAYFETFPNQFIFIDIDAWQTAVDLNIARDNIRTLHRTVSEIAQNLVEYCWS